MIDEVHIKIACGPLFIPPPLPVTSPSAGINSLASPSSNRRSNERLVLVPPARRRLNANLVAPSRPSLATQKSGGGEGQRRPFPESGGVGGGGIAATGVRQTSPRGGSARPPGPLMWPLCSSLSSPLVRCCCRHQFGEDVTETIRRYHGGITEISRRHFDVTTRSK